jgi:hypothetical protein
MEAEVFLCRKIADLYGFLQPKDEATDHQLSIFPNRGLRCWTP